MTVSDNDLSPGRRQAIIGNNDGILFIEPLGEILIEMYHFSFRKMQLKMSSGKWRPFCHRLSGLKLGIHNMGLLFSVDLPPYMLVINDIWICFPHAVKIHASIRCAFYALSRPYLIRKQPSYIRIFHWKFWKCNTCLALQVFLSAVQKHSIKQLFVWVTHVYYCNMLHTLMHAVHSRTNYILLSLFHFAANVWVLFTCCSIYWPFQISISYEILLWRLVWIALICILTCMCSRAYNHRKLG